MTKELKKVWYMTKGAMAFNVKAVSKITFGTVESLSYLVTEIESLPAVWSIEMASMLNDWSQNKINQVSSERFRNILSNMSNVAEITLGVAGIAGSLFVIHCIAELCPLGIIAILGISYLRLDRKISTWADKQMRECNRRLDELNNVNHIPRADNMSGYGVGCLG